MSHQKNLLINNISIITRNNNYDNLGVVIIITCEKHVINDLYHTYEAPKANSEHG